MLGLEWVNRLKIALEFQIVVAIWQWNALFRM